VVDSLSMIRRPFLALPIGALLLLSAPPVGVAMAQTPDPDAPELTYQSVQDGDTFNAPLASIQLCFKTPINIKDKDKGGDFSFDVVEPDGFGLGHRDVFQVDGYGVEIVPGNPLGETEGEWMFKYRVTTPDAQHATTGTIKYNVGPSGQDVSAGTPNPCPATGGTPAPTEPGQPSSQPSVGATATARPSDSGSPSVAATPASGGSEDSGPDILKLALLTIGIAGAAAVLLLIGYFVRRAVHFDWHKPGDGDSGHH